MSDALRFKIEDGVFALALVDTAAVGYADGWQTPGGVGVDVVTLAAYTDSDSQWSCQLQTMTIDPSANNNDETTDATWCQAAKTTPNPGETSFAINGTMIADAHYDESLQAFLYLNDVKEAYFYMGLAGEGTPPAAAGRCRLIASSFGGAGYTTLTATIGALPLSRRYDMWYGETPGTVIEGLTNTSRPGAPTTFAATAEPASSSTADDEAA
jgi:hypothetical protein